MTNILPSSMRREYTDIIFFWKSLYGNYNVDVNDFDFWWHHPCVVQTASNVSFSTEYFPCGILYHLMYVIFLITLLLYPV